MLYYQNKIKYNVLLALSNKLYKKQSLIYKYNYTSSIRYTSIYYI